MGAAREKHWPLKPGEIGLVGVCVAREKHWPLKAGEIGLLHFRTFVISCLISLCCCRKTLSLDHLSRWFDNLSRWFKTFFQTCIQVSERVQRTWVGQTPCTLTPNSCGYSSQCPTSASNSGPHEIGLVPKQVLSHQRPPVLTHQFLVYMLV